MGGWLATCIQLCCIAGEAGACRQRSKRIALLPYNSGASTFLVNFFPAVEAGVLRCCGGSSCRVLQQHAVRCL